MISQPARLPQRPPKNIESHELEALEARPKKVEGDDSNRESTLHTDMLIASLSRDREAFEKAYETLVNLPARKQSDENLITDKLSLEHRMGDETAVGQLASLVEENPDWYEPCQSLASIYYHLGSYDNASFYLTEAKTRAHDDAQRLRSLLLEARIREKTGTASAAIDLLKSSVAGFAELRHQATIWSRVAELHWGRGEKVPSFIAAETALQMEPLDKHLRFRLAFNYGSNEPTRLLSYFHYDKLRNQDVRYPNCLNNMALLLEVFDMPAGCVKLLKQAREFDRPYPHGNLAIALAKAGFLDEGKAMIEELPEDLRLDSRAAEAIEFIAQKQREEAKAIEQLGQSSELFHRVYLTAALNFARGLVIGAGDLVGTWTSGTWALSLEEGPAAEWLVGILEKTGSKYRVKIRCADNLLSGEATNEGSSLSIISLTITYKLLLACESEGRLVGLIYTNEMAPDEVRMARRG